MTSKLLVIKGDGIGPEVIEAGMKLIHALNHNCDIDYAEAGFTSYEETGDSLPIETIDKANNSDVVLLGAVTTPPNIDNYKSPILQMRQKFDLYANVRPNNSLVSSKRDLDITIIRENTEGLYSGISKRDTNTGREIRMITREASARILRYGFEYARQRKIRKVHVIHKGNVLRAGDGLFLECAEKVSEDFPEIEMVDALVDSTAMKLVKSPEDYQLIITTNMFGDILSDLVSAHVGGLGVVPSASIGEKLALFEPVHGSAPHMVGEERANPMATFLSIKMMFEYLGKDKIAGQIQRAIDKCLDENKVTKDLGGDLNTLEFTTQIINNL
jgi:isopropylmalate/isohomocitrate dehydrogenase-like protein